MKNLVRFVVFIIVMTVMTSCATTSHVQYSNDPSGSYYNFNPMGYTVHYSPYWGYHYYDNYRIRFLFDDFIYCLYPELGIYRYGRFHWDCFSYQQNHCFNRIDKHKNFVQQHEVQNYSAKRNSGDGSYQKGSNQGQRQVQGENLKKSQTQGSATRQKSQVNSSSGDSRMLREQNTETPTRVQSGKRLQGVETRTQNTRQGSPTRIQNSGTSVTRQISSTTSSARQIAPVQVTSPTRSNTSRGTSAQPQGISRSISTPSYQRSSPAATSPSNRNGSGRRN